MVAGGLLADQIPDEIRDIMLHPINIAPLQTFLATISAIPDNVLSIVLDLKDPAMLMLPNAEVIHPSLYGAGNAFTQHWREYDVCDYINVFKDIARSSEVLRLLVSTAETQLEEDAILPDFIKLGPNRTKLNSYLAVLINELRESLPEGVTQTSVRIEELEEDVFGAAEGSRVVPTTKAYIVGIAIPFLLMAIAIWFQMNKWGTLAQMLAAAGIAQARGEAVALDMAHNPDLLLQAQLIAEREFTHLGLADALQDPQNRAFTTGGEGRIVTQSSRAFTEALDGALERGDNPKLNKAIIKVDNALQQAHSEQLAIREQPFFAPIEPPASTHRTLVIEVMKNVAMFYKSHPTGGYPARRWERKGEFQDSSFETDFLAWLTNTKNASDKIDLDKVLREPQFLGTQIYAYANSIWNPLSKDRMTADERAETVERWIRHATTPVQAAAFQALHDEVINQEEDMLTTSAGIQRTIWQVITYVSMITFADRLASLLPWVGEGELMAVFFNLIGWSVSSYSLATLLAMIFGEGFFGKRVKVKEPKKPSRSRSRRRITSGTERESQRSAERPPIQHRFIPFTREEVRRLQEEHDRTRFS